MGNDLHHLFEENFLPNWNSIFSFHPWIFPHTRYLIKFKLAFFFFFFLPTTIGKPRYFSYSFISGTPNSTLIVSLVAGETDLLNKSVVFSLLICCLEALSYTSRIFLIQFISPNWARQNNRLSLAKKIVVKSWAHSYKKKILEFNF